MVDYENRVQGSDGKWDDVQPVILVNPDGEYVDASLGGGEGGGGGLTDDELRAAPVDINIVSSDVDLGGGGGFDIGALTNASQNWTSVDIELVAAQAGGLRYLLIQNTGNADCEIDLAGGDPDSTVGIVLAPGDSYESVNNGWTNSIRGKGTNGQPVAVFWRA